MPDTDQPLFDVEVAYALPQQQWVIPLRVPAGTTVGECIELSGIASQVPDLEVQGDQVGIYGQRCGLDQAVQAGDRVEIYRPLKHDPKALRRRRARQQAEAAKSER